MKPQISITGTGLITALGNGVDPTWRALIAGEYIRDHSRICTTSIQPVPVLRDEVEGFASRFTALPRVTQLALIAARESVRAARWTSEQLHDDATALVVGTSKGPVIEWMTAPPGVAYRTNEIFVPAIGLHQIAQTLAHELGLGSGPRQTFSAACASGLHALIQAAILIQSGRVDRALVVAAEASVHPLFVGSFKRLGVLPPEGAGCRPFDINRRGFLMSEAGAAVCLERSDSTDAGFTRIDRFALGADATHITGVDASGTTLRRLLARVIDQRPVDLIHAHGTGTAMNDPIELAAIEDALIDRDRPAYLYSHKGALGHSLGAAGLISVVLNTESHRRGIIPPNTQTQTPMPTRSIRICRQATNASIRRSIAIATGFGGPTAVISCVSA